MAKQKYRSAATGGRFKQRGQGLRVAEDRIREQRKTEIDAITLAKYQHQEVSGNYISGIADAQRFEMGVLEEKQKLENKVREHKYNALVKKADTDVKRLEDEAKAKQKTADWWADFAPKFASNLGKLAKGGLEFADAYRGQKQWEALKASGILDEITDQKEAVNSKLFGNITKDGHIGDPDESNTLHDRTFKVSTHWASKRLAKWYKENKQLVRSDTIAAWEASGGEYGEDNAVEVQKFNAHQLLTQLGVSPTSQGGKEILESAIQLGRADRKVFSDVRKVGETETRISEQLKNLKSLDINSDDFRINYHQLVNLHKNGYFKTDSGISSPYDNPRSIADGLELATKAYIDANIEHLSDSDINTILSLQIPDTGTGEKATLEQKHQIRAENIREYWLDKSTKHLTDLNNRKESKGLQRYQNTYKADFDNQKWLFDDNNERLTGPDGEPLSIDQEKELKKAWQFKTINAIATDKNLTDKSRSLAYALVGFDSKNHAIAVDYALIQTDYFNGDVESAIERFNTLSSEEQKKMQPLIEKYRALENSGYQYNNKPGAIGLFDVTESHFKGGQQAATFKSNNLGPNALEKLAETNKIVWNKYESFLVEYGGKGNEEKAARATQDWFITEWNQGGLTEGQPGYVPNHWLAREEGKAPGEKMVFLDKKDDILVNIRFNKAIKKIHEGKEVPTVTKENLELALRKPEAASLIPGHEEGDNPWLILNSETVIPNKDVLTIANQVLNAKAGLYTEGASDFTIPPLLHTFVEHYIGTDDKPITMAHAITELIKMRREDFPEIPDVKILHGEEDLINWVKNDKIVTKKQNLAAVDRYSSGIANTGVVPQRKNVRAYLKGDKDIMQVFSETTGIGLTQNTDENGKITYSYSGENEQKEFLLNGGLDLPVGLSPIEFMYAVNFPALMSVQANAENNRQIANKEKWDRFFNRIDPSMRGRL